MTAQEFREARRKLGLSQSQLARVMGYAGAQQISNLERGVYAVTEQAARLMAAYLAGYRPPDWPQGRSKTEDG